MDIGIIGLGHWGRNYLKILKSKKQIKNIYCYDLKKIDDLASEKIIVIKNLRILYSNNIKIVFISTPAKTHFKLLKDFMRFNKKIFIEKPVCLKQSEINFLRSTYRDYKKLIMVDHTFLYHPAIIKIKELLKGSLLKDVKYIESIRKHFGLFRDDVDALWDLIPHDISICNYIFGERPTSGTLIASSIVTNKIDLATVKLNYKNNLFAIIHLSWANIFKERSLFINSLNTKILFDDLSKDKLSRCDYNYDNNYKLFRSKQLSYYKKKNIKINKSMPLNNIIDVFLKSNRKTKVISDLNFGINICEDILKIKKLS